MNRALAALPLFALLVAACKPDAPEPTAAPAKAPSPAAPAAAPLSQDAFFEAALNGEEATVRDALARGTVANDFDHDGRSALMLAAFNGHTGTVRLLLGAGAPLDARDRTGRTALMYACSGDNPDTVRLLLDHRAGVNLSDNEEHWTPLMFAAAEGHLEVARLLLAAGADPRAADIDGEDSELFARNRGFEELAALVAAAKRK